MPEVRPPLQEIDWQELVPGLLLIRTVRLAKQFSKLFLGAAGLAATVAGWTMLVWLFSGDPGAARLEQSLVISCPLANHPHPERLVTRWIDQATTSWGDRGAWHPQDVAWLAHHPWWETWELLTRPLRRLFDAGLSLSACVCLLLCGLWTVVVWGLFGGAICRIAAIQLAREERVGLMAALRYSAGRLRAYVGAATLPLWLVLCLVLLASIISWLARFDFGFLVVAVLAPLGLVLALGIVFLLAGFFAGWPLMWGTVSVEGTDGFDGISRAYAYTSQRPLEYLAYLLAAAVYGVLGWLWVAGLFAGSVCVLYWALGWGVSADRLAEIRRAVPDEVIMIGRPPVAQLSAEEVAAAYAPPGAPWPAPPATAEPAGGTDAAVRSSDTDPASTKVAKASSLSGPGRAGVWVLTAVLGIWKCLALAFAPSYFWTSCTAIYLLVRRHADHTELDQAFVETPAKGGLPRLAFDKDGVPMVAEEAAPTDPSATATAPPKESAAGAAPPAPPAAGDAVSTSEPAAAVDTGNTGIVAADERAENDGG